MKIAASDFGKKSPDPRQELENRYWAQYESEMKELAEAIVEHAGYLQYDLNPTGRFRNEFEGFAGNALFEIQELHQLLSALKAKLEPYVGAQAS